MRLSRTNSNDQDFLGLVQLLDADLALRDGEDHAFYNQYNGVDGIRYAVVLYEGEKAIACGAIKKLFKDAMEVKRMYVIPSKRGSGIATVVLKELEKWATELKMNRLILETGKRQPEAIRLYQKNGYLRIENFGPYVGVENSVCFEKKLNSTVQY
jgi:GNAT superfamily N-acetyltransferase